jgi:hypothetical protein
VRHICRSLDNVLARNAGRGATGHSAQRNRPAVSASQRIDRSGYALRHSRPGVRQVGLSRSSRSAQGERPGAVRLSGGTPARRKGHKRLRQNCEDETSDEEWRPDDREQQDESDGLESVQVESNVSSELR